MDSTVGNEYGPVVDTALVLGTQLSMLRVHRMQLQEETRGILYLSTQDRLVIWRPGG
jgi:hypothetical protein